MNETKTPRKLVRSRNDRFVGGVAAGIAQYFNIDPVLIRVAFVVSIAFGGAGILAYIALLILVPVDGEPGDPADQPTGLKRALIISGAVLVGLLALASIDGGWFFGLGPGPLFEILFLLLVVGGVIWLVRVARSGDDDGAGQPPPSAPSTSGGAETATLVSSSGQEPTTEVMAKAAGDESVEPGETPPAREVDRPQAAQAPQSSGAQVGRVIVWIGIGLAALVVFSVLAVVTVWTTAEFGAIPMASLVILLGGGVVFAALRGRSQLAVWMLATALVVAVPMAAVSLADIRIEGGYGEFKEEPVIAGEIPEDGYQLAAGLMTVDMRQYPFRAGQSVNLPLDSGLGMTRVIVPDGVCVSGRVQGKAGLTEIRGTETEGMAIDRELSGPVGSAPELNLDADFKLGYFEVIDESTWKDDRYDRWKDGKDGDFEWDEDRDPALSAEARERGESACLSEPEPVRKKERKAA